MDETEVEVSDESQMSVDEALDVLYAMPAALGILIERLDQRVSVLEVERDADTSRIQDLEERLASFLAKETGLRTDVYDDRHLAHIRLANEYGSWISQSLMRVARAMPRKSGQELTEHLAHWVGEFASTLLKDPHAGQDRVLEILIQNGVEDRERVIEACRRISHIQGEIALLGVQHEWDFRIDGDNFDEDRQEIWLGAEPVGRVARVIAPGYAVQGVMYQKQLVLLREATPKIRRRPSDST